MRLPFKFALTLLVVLFSLAASTVKAVLVDSDSFNYANGNLTDNTAWSAHSGIGSNEVQVASGKALVTHGSGSREDVNNSFSTFSSGKIYYGMTFSVDDLGAAYSGSVNAYFAHFNSSGSFVGRLSIVPPNASGDFTLGLATGSSTPEVEWTADLDFANDYRAIVEFDIDENQARLWVNPLSEPDPSITGSNFGGSPSVSSFVLRQSDSSEDETIRIDDLVIGTTFNDVVAVAAVPEPSSYLFGSVLCGLLGMKYRRNRNR